MPAISSSVRAKSAIARAAGSVASTLRTSSNMCSILLASHRQRQGIHPAKSIGKKADSGLRSDPWIRPALDDALTDREAVLRAFVRPDGTLSAIPTRIRKRLVVLNEMAQAVRDRADLRRDPVNNTLRPWHDDVAALRRYLVEEGFLERRDGLYWRAGGTIEYDDDAGA